MALNYTLGSLAPSPHVKLYLDESGTLGYSGEVFTMAFVLVRDLPRLETSIARNRTTQTESKASQMKTSQKLALARTLLEENDLHIYLADIDPRAAAVSERKLDKDLLYDSMAGQALAYYLQRGDLMPGLSYRLSMDIRGSLRESYEDLVRESVGNLLMHREVPLVSDIDVRFLDSKFSAGVQAADLFSNIYRTALLQKDSPCQGFLRKYAEEGVVSGGFTFGLPQLADQMEQIARDVRAYAEFVQAGGGDQEGLSLFSSSMGAIQLGSAAEQGSSPSAPSGDPADGGERNGRRRRRGGRGRGGRGASEAGQAVISAGEPVPATPPENAPASPLAPASGNLGETVTPGGQTPAASFDATALNPSTEPVDASPTPVAINQQAEQAAAIGGDRDASAPDGSTKIDGPAEPDGDSEDSAATDLPETKPAGTGRGRRGTRRAPRKHTRVSTEPQAEEAVEQVAPSPAATAVDQAEDTPQVAAEASSSSDGAAAPEASHTADTPLASSESQQTSDAPATPSARTEQAAPAEVRADSADAPAQAAGEEASASTSDSGKAPNARRTRGRSRSATTATTSRRRRPGDGGGIRSEAAVTSEPAEPAASPAAADVTPQASEPEKAEPAALGETVAPATPDATTTPKAGAKRTRTATRKRKSAAPAETKAVEDATLATATDAAVSPEVPRTDPTPSAKPAPTDETSPKTDPSAPTQPELPAEPTATAEAEGAPSTPARRTRTRRSPRATKSVKDEQAAAATPTTETPAPAAPDGASDNPAGQKESQEPSPSASEASAPKQSPRSSRTRRPSQRRKASTRKVTDEGKTDQPESSE